MTANKTVTYVTTACILYSSFQVYADANQTSFIGYARTGLGTGDNGDTQVTFQAPGAPVKYRLGNEADTFVELGFDHRFSLPPNLSKANAPSSFQLVAMLQSYAPYGESNNLDIDSISQLYIKADDLIAPGVDVWIGRRYYGRREIHLNDYFWLNSGQGAHAGAGIEGLKTGLGQFHAAVFMIEDKLSDSGQHINTTTLDLRHDGITVGDTGEIGLWLYGALRHQEVELNLEERSGFGFGIWHQHAPIPNSTNTLSLVYREGAAIPQGKINPQPVREAQGYDLNQANRWEVNNDFLYEPASPFALHWSLIYRHDESGVEGNTGDELVWLSTGIRPIYYFDDHLNLAFEYGFDWVENERTTLDGSLHKGTLALQMAISRGYFARPVLRLFATYAKWSDDFRGLVGTRPGDMAYANDTSGWSLGIQMEAWW